MKSEVGILVVHSGGAAEFFGLRAGAFGLEASFFGTTGWAGCPAGFAYLHGFLNKLL